MRSKEYTEYVREVAKHQWKSIFRSLGGLPEGILDSRHHPCPMCGGNDRFRLVDEAAGALFCNKCFDKRNGDGFAAISWLLGCNFPQAVDKVGEYLNIPKDEKSKKKAFDPESLLDYFNPTPWNYHCLLQHYPEMTREVLDELDARFAFIRKTGHMVVVFPIWPGQPHVGKPCGWNMYSIHGDKLPIKSQNGTEWVKCKMLPKSKSGQTITHKEDSNAADPN